MDEFEHEHEHEHERGLPLRHHGFGGVRGFFRGVEHKLDRLSVVQGVLLAAGSVLALDWLVAPKGKSLVGQAIERFSPGGGAHAALPPHVGANLGAGFGHGYMPYGGWAHADPGGPTQYAHAAQRRVADLNVHGWYDWE
jgi:hypothetical protein